MDGAYCRRLEATHQASHQTTCRPSQSRPPASLTIFRRSADGYRDLENLPPLGHQARSSSGVSIDIPPSGSRPRNSPSHASSVHIFADRAIAADSIGSSSDSSPANPPFTMQHPKVQWIKCRLELCSTIRKPRKIPVCIDDSLKSTSSPQWAG